MKIDLDTCKALSKGPGLQVPSRKNGDGVMVVEMVMMMVIKMVMVVMVVMTVMRWW